MSKLIRRVCAVAVSVGIVQSVYLSAEESAEYDGAELRRWSAIVADLDETIYLYTDILGFELGDVTTDPKTSYVYEVFNISRDITTRHATFHAGDNKRVLSVVEVPGVNLPKPPQHPRMSVTLLNAKGRFDEIYTRLVDEGYSTLKPHALGSRGIEVGFIDKDGHLYAMYEFPYKGEIEIQSSDASE